MLLRYPHGPLDDSVLRIRPWLIDDLACVEAASQDPNIPVGTTVPAVYTAEAGRAFLLRQQARLDQGEGISLAITDPDTDRAIGLLYLARRPQAWIAGLGYWLIPAARGRRLGARAIRLLTEWALRDLEILRLEAWVAPDNVASQRTLAGAGFALEGRLRNFLQLAGQTTDGLVYSRIAGNPHDTALAVGHPDLA